MKLLSTIFLFSIASSLNAQTFITMAGGTSTKKDVAIHAAIGYQYQWLSVEAGFIGAPLNTNRPLFVTGLLTVDLPLSDNWTMISVTGVAVKTWEPGKNSEATAMPYGGIRLKWKDIFIQVSHTDKTYFFSIGLKGFFKEEY